MRLGVAGAYVAGEIVPGDVVVEGSTIASIGLTGGSGSGVAVPGFVDVQVNGFAGVDFSRCSVEDHARAAAALAATGVTSYLITIPTADPERYDEIIEVAMHAVADLAGPIGVHLEGPFLNPTRRGAHRAEWLQPPRRGFAPTLMTLAPELDGAMDLLRYLAEAGVVISVGHSDATAEQAHAAFDAGATAHTHVWNAHRPITSRDPGPATVALTRPDVAPCVIPDLVHSAADSLRLVTAAASDRYIAVTDAVALAGMPDGSYGGLTKADGAIRLADGTLAGSAASMDQCLRNLVAIGRPLEEALASMTARPAALLGRTDIGDLTVGGRADIVVLDDDLSVRSVLVAGRPA